MIPMRTFACEGARKIDTHTSIDRRAVQGSPAIVIVLAAAEPERERMKAAAGDDLDDVWARLTGSLRGLELTNWSAMGVALPIVIMVDHRDGRAQCAQDPGKPDQRQQSHAHRCTALFSGSCSPSTLTCLRTPFSLPGCCSLEQLSARCTQHAAGAALQ